MNMMNASATLRLNRRDNPAKRTFTGKETTSQTKLNMVLTTSQTKLNMVLIENQTTDWMKNHNDDRKNLTTAE